MRSPSRTKDSIFIPVSDVSCPGVVNTTCLMCTLYYSEAHTAPECQNDKRDPERGERGCKYWEWQESFQYNSVTAHQNIHNMRSRILQQSRQNITQYFTILKVYEENVKLTNINIRMIETVHCWEVTLVTLTILSPASKCTCGVKNFCK